MDSDVIQDDSRPWGRRKMCSCDKSLSEKNPSQRQMSRAGVMLGSRIKDRVK